MGSVRVFTSRSEVMEMLLRPRPAAAYRLANSEAVQQSSTLSQPFRSAIWMGENAWPMWSTPNAARISMTRSFGLCLRRPLLVRSPC